MVKLPALKWLFVLVCAVCTQQKEADLHWWQTTILYQIYPRSFQDSNGDGVGDIQGIISRLDYIKSLYVDTIWLSPIYTSPMADFGYDVADYQDIDPLFGTLADFDQLVEEVHARRMKIVMDFVPNHTSEDHPWFRASETGTGPYADYYVWHDGKLLSDNTRAPPNNWLSIFGGSAWTWVEERQQYYLHQFTSEQPDLNYRNPEVVTAMKDVLRFWLKRGVDGFRVDAILTLFEVTDLSLDEPRSYKEGFTSEESEYLDHIYTLYQPEIHDVVRGWDEVINTYSKEANKEIFTVLEVYDPTLHHAMEYYHSGSGIPFNFGLIFVNETCGGTCFQDIINSWMEAMPKGKWPNFVIGNHDQRRISTRKGAEYINALNMMLLTLPGTPTTYYGEEIGMLDIPLPSYDDIQDPFGIKLGPDLYGKYTRDPCRSPMQWDNSSNAGFSTTTRTWLPIHENYQQVNVQAQEEDLQSTLEIYREVAQLRQNKAFQNNQLTFHVVSDNILSYIRWGGGDSAFLVILNLGTERANHEYSWPLGDDNIKVGTVLVTTGYFGNDDSMKPFNVIPLSNLSLNPGQGLLLQIKLLDKTLLGRQTDEL